MTLRRGSAGSVLVVGLLCRCGALGAQAPGDSVQLRDVKYAGLADAIKSHRGKVVLVDFWADFCVPCKKGLPHVVALHKKLAGEGLVVMSVSLDPIDDPNSRARALRFLKDAGAAFTNLYLDEPPALWQKKLGILGPPCYFVFSRGGKWTKFDASDTGTAAPGEPRVDYEAMERFIALRLRDKQ